MKRILLTFIATLFAASAYAQVGTQPVTGSKFCFVNCGTGPQDLSGTATTPEATVAACVGSTYRKTNGTTDTTLWKKETGSCTSSGWVAIAAGAGATPSFTTLRVGNNTPVLTSPTRGFDFRYLHSGSLSSSVFHGGSFDTTFTPSATWSGNGIGMYFRTGTTAQAHSANLYGIVSEISSTSSGTETGNIGFNMNLIRTGGTTTYGIGGEYGITAGNSGTITNGIGMQILSPVETGGTPGVISNYDGIRILDSSVSGVAFGSNRSLAIVYPSSGFEHHYANGMFQKSTTMSSDEGQAFNLDQTTYTGGAPGGGRSFLQFDFTLDTSANIPTAYQGASFTLYHKGTRTYNGGYAASGWIEIDDTATLTADWPAAVDGEFGNYSTTTVPQLNGVSCGGYATGTGSTTTRAYCMFIDSPWQTDGTVTNAVGLQINDQTYPGTSAANNWGIRYSAPSSKTFGVRANGDMVLGGVLYTFPSADASGCLQSNGSGTLSWASCAGSSGYTTVKDEGTSLTTRATLNFTGAGVTCVDNGGSTRTDCTISGGASTSERTGITVDGGGSAITTGIKGFSIIPKTGTIVSATLLSTDASATACSAVFDVWVDTYANYPPTVADTITASAKPTISSANKSQDNTLTGWTTSVTAGGIMGYKIDSTSGCTRLQLVLEIQ